MAFRKRKASNATARRAASKKMYADEGGPKSASGKGTISRTKALGWAFDESKKDPAGCVRVDSKGVKLSKPVPGPHTFDGWSELGYRVSKGEKSSARDKDGKPTFTLSQVWKPKAGYVPPPQAPNAWSKPSGLVEEVKARVEAKAKAEEAKHLHIPDDFEPEIFSEEDSPPW